MNNLRLLDKNKRKNYKTQSRRLSVANSVVPGIDDVQRDGIYGGWFSKKKKKDDDNTDDVYQFSGKNDEEKQADASEQLEQYEEPATMQSYISDMLSQLTVANPNETEMNKKDQTDTEINQADGDPAGSQLFEVSPASFDPRIVRFDAFKSTSGIVPFADTTAASVYYDMVFSVEKAVAKMGGFKENDGAGEDGLKASDRVAPNTTEVNKLKQDPEMYGVQSMMNPYCVTRLVGGLTGIANDWHSHMYDVRDRKRFYDNAGFGGGSIVETDDDFVSITNPTTTNIITWSNKDRWGRTPYSFQDFVFCKWWNIIPNNRLITLRKYAVPTYDNLNFPGMEEPGEESTQTPKP